MDNGLTGGVEITGSLFNSKNKNNLKKKKGKRKKIAFDLKKTLKLYKN